MAEKSRTKDEKFMVRLYEEALKKGDMDEPFDRYVIGQMIGLQHRGVDAICTLLLQANFAKKRGPTDISITPHGIKLVKSIIE